MRLSLIYLRGKKEMHNLIQTFTERKADWIQALIEHLQISLLSLLIAIVIAVPLGMWIYHRQKAAEISLQISGILQTIPSLALLGLLIPFVGIGVVPALIALILYAIFPILQGTITGLQGIDENLKEAGTAFGMNRFERLRYFELPLALPVIVAGVRTSAVMIIGTATLAALIGAGGLGTFITLGIDRSNQSLILLGAISSAVLAVLVNLGLKLIEKAKLRTIVVSFGVMILALLGSYLPQVLPQVIEKNDDTIVIAGKLGAEPDILINMYKELIENDSSLKVELKPNFGKTDFLYQALKSKKIDIYPEFSGTITSSLLKNPPKTSTDEATVYALAKSKIKQQDNLDYLKPMKYQNTYAIAVPEKFAKENNLKKISDLSRVQDQLKAGFSAEFADRKDGYLGLESKYNLKFPYQTMEPALRYQAIGNGDLNLIDVYSTDSQIKQNHLVVLKDDQKLFPPYQGAPLLRAGLLKEHPELKPILNKLAGKITAEQMATMNYEVDVQGKSAKDVAHQYLMKNHLLK